MYQQRAWGLSFEFYPPKTSEGEALLLTEAAALATLKPDYCSVTYGAGGSTREKTLSTVMALRTALQLSLVPHVSCIGSTRAQIKSLLDSYLAEGFKRLVALRGDIPSGMGGGGEFRHANELLQFIRAEYGTQFKLEVAAYPEVHPGADSAHKDFHYFCEKARLADGAITQYFFNVEAYVYFVERVRKAGLTLPIVPGIMPLTNASQIIRFSEMCGAEIPRYILKQLQSYGDDKKAISQFGIEIGIKLCQRLLAEDAPGLHFYTLNKAPATRAICEAL